MYDKKYKRPIKTISGSKQVNIPAGEDFSDFEVGDWVSIEKVEKGKLVMYIDNKEEVN